MAYALWLGKPLVLLPQTIGPLRRWWERRLVRWLSQRAQLIFVRDALSLALLQELNAGKPLPHLHLVPDIAFAYPAPPLAIGRQFLATHQIFPTPNQPLLGVTVLDWGAQNANFGQQAGYETAVALAIRAFIQATGGQAVLFSQVHGPQPADDDRRPAQRVYAQLADLGEQVRFIPDECPAATLKAAYGQMDFFLGSRLHSCIFALSMGVPVVAIQYQYKTIGVMEMLGMGEWVLPIEQSAAQPELLAQLLLAGWAERHELRAKINHCLPQLMRETTAVAQKIQQQYTQSPTNL
jgi:colanic acid/amylovoran biosynthesis protein